MIQAQCDSCGGRFRLQEEHAGKRVRCPKCEEPIQVPEVREHEEEQAVEVTEESSTRSSRRAGRAGRVTGSYDALPPLAIGGALVAAILGAVVWAFIAKGTGYEIGWVAWGVGGLVGVAMKKLGAHGEKAGALAAVFTVLAIAGGKFSGTLLMLREAEQQDIEESIMPAHYDELCVDARDLVALGESPSDEVVIVYLVEHGFVEGDELSVSSDEIELFRQEVAPSLRDFDERSPDYDSWRADVEEGIHEFWETELSITDVMIEDLGLFDLLFAFLGISTAFKLLTGRR